MSDEQRFADLHRQSADLRRLAGTSAGRFDGRALLKLARDCEAEAAMIGERLLSGLDSPARRN